MRPQVATNGNRFQPEHAASRGHAPGAQSPTRAPSPTPHRTAPLMVGHGATEAHPPRHERRPAQGRSSAPVPRSSATVPRSSAPVPRSSAPEARSSATAPRSSATAPRSSAQEVGSSATHPGSSAQELRSSPSNARSSPGRSRSSAPHLGSRTALVFNAVRHKRSSRGRSRSLPRPTRSLLVLERSSEPRREVAWGAPTLRRALCKQGGRAGYGRRLPRRGAGPPWVRASRARAAAKSSRARRRRL